MTQFETLSLIISCAAIVSSIGIPLAGYIYRKTRRPKVEIHEFEYRPLTIMYSHLGNRIRFNFSIMSKNASCVIRSIEANVCSELNGNRMEMRWVVMEPIHLDWANGMGNVINLNSLTHVHPLLVNADTMVPLSLHFEPLNNERFLTVHKNLPPLRGDELPDITERQKLCEHPEIILGSKNLHAHEQRLREPCFWRRGRYNLSIKLLFDANRTFEKNYCFNLSAEEAERLQSNAAKLLLCGSCSTNANPEASCCEFVSKDIEKSAE